jgi:hypothetical protein
VLVITFYQLGSPDCRCDMSARIYVLTLTQISLDERSEEGKEEGPQGWIERDRCGAQDDVSKLKYSC